MPVNKARGTGFASLFAGWHPEASEPHTKEPVIEKGIAYAGLDAHGTAISIAVYFPGRRLRPEEVRIPHEAKAAERWTARRWSELEGTSTPWLVSSCWTAVSRNPRRPSSGSSQDRICSQRGEIRA